MESVLFAATPRKRTPNTLLTGNQTAVSGRIAVRTSEKHVEWRPKELIRDQKNCNYMEYKDAFGDVMEEENSVSRDGVTASRLSAVLRDIRTA